MFLGKGTYEATPVIPGKASPQVTQAIPNGMSGGVSMKLAEMRGEQEVDSDQEERNGLAQDRMRLKKNISVTGNYQMTKVSPAGGPGANGAGNDGKETAEGKNRSNSVGGKAQAINNVEKMKKNNLTASNPIIGAPLGSQNAKKSEKFLGTNV